MSNFQSIIVSGLLNNLLLCLISFIIPFLVGILLSYYSGSKINKFIDIFFNSISPVALVVAIGLCVFTNSKTNIIACCLAFSISHIGYMSSHYNEQLSEMGNIVVNGIGLFSSIFKWSMCVGFIGTIDILKSSLNIMSRTYQSVYSLIPLGISFMILLILNITKMLIRNRCIGTGSKHPHNKKGSVLIKGKKDYYDIWLSEFTTYVDFENDIFPTVIEVFKQNGIVLKQEPIFSGVGKQDWVSCFFEKDMNGHFTFFRDSKDIWFQFERKYDSEITETLLANTLKIILSSLVNKGINFRYSAKKGKYGKNVWEEVYPPRKTYM